jgi:hypothetical protein
MEDNTREEDIMLDGWGLSLSVAARFVEQDAQSRRDREAAEQLERRKEETPKQPDEREWLMTPPARVRRAYDFWKNNLKSGGFKFGTTIINYSGGEPGAVRLFFSWPKCALDEARCQPTE